jgi:hypothetical protein
MCTINGTYLLLMCTVIFASAACDVVVQRPVVHKPESPQQMDKIVHDFGIPLRIEETFEAHPSTKHIITLYYRGGVYRFQTDEGKTYSALLSSSVRKIENLQQETIPLWFKNKYPDLDYAGLSIK